MNIGTQINILEPLLYMLLKDEERYTKLEQRLAIGATE